jgi:hypothetical protein
VFKILNKLNRAITRTKHTQAQRDVTILVADWLQGGHLHAAWEHGLKVFHRQRPRERFRIEKLIQILSLSQDRSILRLAHHCLVALALMVNARNLGGECLVANACILSFPVQDVQPNA